MGGKHHHPHGGHGGRGFRRFRGGPVVVDYGPDVFEPACYLRVGPDGKANWECPPYEAGHVPFDDAMGIFGSTSAQRTAVSAENGNWVALMAAMMAGLAAGKVNSAYTNAFTDKKAGWDIFADSILNQNASMSEDEFTGQLDQWKTERSAWAQDLSKKTGIELPIISQAPPPKQDKPDPFSDFLSKGTGLLLAGALLAGILVFGGRGSRHVAYY